jgi:hypothetical protein
MGRELRHQLLLLGRTGGFVLGGRRPEVFPQLGEHGVDGLGGGAPRPFGHLHLAEHQFGIEGVVEEAFVLGRVVVDLEPEARLGEDEIVGGEVAAGDDGIMLALEPSGGRGGARKGG